MSCHQLLYQLPLQVTLLLIEVDTGASISLLNWETFQKVNYKSNISSFLTKSKLKTYSGEIVSAQGKSDIEFSYEGI